MTPHTQCRVSSDFTASHEAQGLYRQSGRAARRRSSTTLLLVAVALVIVCISDRAPLAHARLMQRGRSSTKALPTLVLRLGSAGGGESSSTVQPLGGGGESVPDRDSDNDSPASTTTVSSDPWWWLKPTKPKPNPKPSHDDAAPLASSSSTGGAQVPAPEAEPALSSTGSAQPPSASSTGAATPVSPPTQPESETPPPSDSSPAPLRNTATFVVDGSLAASSCNDQQIPAGNDCFFGSAVDFKQVCSPACYWGGLCRDGLCVKQKNNCIVFCPRGFTCSYGYCVSETLEAQFLQTITPFLYTDRALVQPSNPATQPLYTNPSSPSDAVSGDAGVGGQVGSDTEEVPLAVSAAARGADAVVLSYLGPFLLLALLAWNARV